MSDIKDESVEETVDEVIVEDTQVEELDIPDAPLTAARTVSAIKASLSEMSKEGLDEIFEAAEKAKAKAKVEDDEEEDDEEAFSSGSRLPGGDGNGVRLRSSRFGDGSLAGVRPR